MSVRLWASVLFGFSLVASACSSDPDQTVEQPLDQVQSGAEVADEFPLGVFGAGSLGVAAGAYSDFHEGGTGRVRWVIGGWEPILRDSGFTYVVEGDRIELTQVSGDCEAGATGSYRWSVEESVLRLEDPQDACRDRRVALHSNWYPLGDTPVIEVDPGGDPVTIDSPIGPIEWQVVPGQAYAWAGTDPQYRDLLGLYRQVVAIEGGFVAVVDDQPNMPPIDDQPNVADRELAFSQNGIDWQPLPPPPSTVGLIAADGEKLYVVPATAPDVVSMTTDRGESWTALTVEDPPVSIDGLYAGPAGVVLTSSDVPLWLLDGESFRKVATSPGQMVEVLVLDNGFFALSVDPENVLKSYWRSDDGRTWTEATDVTTDMRGLTSWGDNVYLLSNWIKGIGYTSTDGGRTWSTPTMRPGEGLAVTDAGYFTHQPAIFSEYVGVVWVSSDDVDWQRVVNPWPPLYTFDPVISGDTILIPSAIETARSGMRYLDLVGSIN